MSTQKKIGQVLLYLALLFMITAIIDNSTLWLIVNVLVIIVTVSSGVILISDNKEQK